MEGAIIFASLVVGVAITDQLTSLHRLLRERDKVRWDPLCLATALLITLTIIMVWWSIAGGIGEAITIGQFLPTFAVLVSLFLLAAASLPDRPEQEGGDLFAYYDHQSRYIWAIFTLSSLFASASNIVDAIRERWSLSVILDNYGMDVIVVTFLMGSLIFVRRRWWHWIVLAVLYVGPLNWLSRSLG